MRVRFDWALYAIKHSAGHGWRAGSTSRHDVPAGLDEFTDLAGGSEGQRDWQAYHAGRAFDSVFAFTYTQPEPTVGNEREGRVRTRVLFAPLADLVMATNITPVLEALTDEMNFAGNLGAFDLDLPQVPLTLTPASAHILDTLAAHPNARVVHVGQDNAAELIAQIWSALWPQARSQFSFRLHFDPSELTSNTSEPPQLVITPSERRWSHGTGYQLAAPQAEQLALIQHLTSRPRNVAAEVLREATTGERGRWRRLNNLILDIEDARDDESIRTLSAALSTLDIAPVTSAYQTAVRTELLTRLISQLRTASAADIVPLTMLVLDDQPLQQAVTHWARTLLDDTQLSALLERLNVAQPWFTEAIMTGLQQTHPTPARARQVWAHWAEWQTLRTERAIFGPDWDATLAVTAPHHVPPAVLEIAQARGWWQVFTALQARRDHYEALEAVLNDVPETYLESALATLRRVWGEQAFVLTVIQAADPRAYPEAGHAIVNAPQVLSLMNVQQDAWVTLWTRVLPDLPDVWTGITDTTTIMSGILHRIRSQRAVPDALLEAIAHSDAANLLTIPDRESLWPYLPPPFLRKTAEAWLTSHSPGVAEPTLLTELLQRVPATQPTPAAARELLLQAAPRMTPRTLLKLLNRNGDLHDVDLDAALDHAIRERHGLIQELFDLAGVRAVAPLLALFERFEYRLNAMQQVRLARHLRRPVAEEIWWLALLQVMESAFPDGPTEPWTLLGGKRKHLLKHGTLDEQWKQAIARLRSRQMHLLGPLLYEAGQNLLESDDTTVLWESLPDLHHHLEDDLEDEEE